MGEQHQTGGVSLWLPFPPSVNNLFAHAPVKGRVRRFPTKGYKAWRQEAVIRILAYKHPRFTVPVVIKLELTPKDSRRRDASNYIKAVEDALVEARLIPDDDQRWVKAVIPYWENPSSNPGVRVTIRPAKLEGRREAMTAAERNTLARIRRAGNRLVRANYKPSAAVMGLVAKGYVIELPGLIPDAPQGYALAE